VKRCNSLNALFSAILNPMKVTGFILIILLALPAYSPSVIAGDRNGGDAFAEGVEAYDGGEYETALERWHEAAGKGHGDAIAALADMLYRGIGTPVDIDGAIWWYTVAARMGDAVAKMTLGEFAARGIGGPRDRVTAYRWVGLAAEQGYAWAIQQRHIYARGMDDKALRTADQLISRGIFPRG
jgi:TPR repeat protein